MSTVWAARFVRMRGTRRLIGSDSLGSMANAMPQAIGAAALDRDSQVVALCGDGDAAGGPHHRGTYQLLVKLIVFDNNRLGMVKLEMEQAGLPEYGTQLANPDPAAVASALARTGIRVTDPDDVDGAVQSALATPGPVLPEVLTDADGVAVLPNVTLSEAWGFAIAKSKKFLACHD